MSAPMHDYLLTGESDDELGFFPTDVINAERPRTKRERLIDVIMDLVKDDNENSDYLSKQSHLADLAWIVKELRGTLASHGNDEHNHAVVIGRIQLLASALDKRIVEIG